MLRRHTDEHVHMIFRQHAFDDLDTEFAADLTDDLSNPKAKLAAQYVVSIFGRPNHVITVIIDGVATLAVDHDPAPETMDSRLADPLFLEPDHRSFYLHAKALRLEDEGLNPVRGKSSEPLSHLEMGYP